MVGLGGRMPVLSAFDCFAWYCRIVFKVGFVSKANSIGALKTGQLLFGATFLALTYLAHLLLLVNQSSIRTVKPSKDDSSLCPQRLLILGESSKLRTSPASKDLAMSTVKRSGRCDTLNEILRFANYSLL